MDTSWFGKIHQGDCVAGLGRVPPASVDLVFADPPFNIGFHYDQYDDRRSAADYLQWSRDWMEQVHRVLCSAGAFWLAIGDEYAAELKLIAQEIGFHTRNWVVWYYTFGVHCKQKFTRSHAHLFYFVKDPNSFQFNLPEIAVPSARQLVYNDKRSHPQGRSPDDTWILRPQDCWEGFAADEDTWYFPRVAGTFKERAGFHGCQMPEQLLGRIIRACTQPGQLVVDPFAGSAATLVVAKKLGRNFFGFELSPDYVALGTQRLTQVAVGEPLVGAEEPRGGAPSTYERYRLAREEVLPLFAQELQARDREVVELAGKTSRGFSLERLLVDPFLNRQWQQACDQAGLTGTPAERNRYLLRLKKNGGLARGGFEMIHPTQLSWEQLDPLLTASEVAGKYLVDLYAGDLTELLCDPQLAEEFDAWAQRIAPGFSPLEYRWGAIKMRQAWSQRWPLVAPTTTRPGDSDADSNSQDSPANSPATADISLAEHWSQLEQRAKQLLAQTPRRFAEWTSSTDLPAGPGLFALASQERPEQLWLVGEARNLRSRLAPWVTGTGFPFPGFAAIHLEATCRILETPLAEPLAYQAALVRVGGSSVWNWGAPPRWLGDDVGEMNGEGIPMTTPGPATRKVRRRPNAALRGQ